MNNSKTRMFVLAATLAFLGLQNDCVEATSFSNSSSISVPGSGTEGVASPYPSIINVSGLTGPITDVNVSINGLSHTTPDNLDFLLVGPGGEKIMLMSDAGGPHNIVNLTLTFDDEALGFPANGSALVGGSFKPVNYTGNGGPNDGFPAPAPAGPYGTLLSIFDGTNANGDWQLFVVDDQANGAGSIANGWSIEIATAVPEPATWILVGTGLIAVVRRRKKV
jgi:hypothetical protein